MRREKRVAILKAHVPQSLKEQYELFVEEEGAMVSMSDYLFGVLEEHAAVKAMRVGKHRIVRRSG